jgi:pimeloyl-ACP methyl ester carboxylesterase
MPERAASRPPTSMRPRETIVTSSLRTDDGAVLAVHELVPPTADAKTIVLANGLGGPAGAWRALFDDLGDRYRLVTWDYRGLYGSTRPTPELPSSYGIPRHVDDLGAILRHLHIERASFVGWSMGVQVVIEAYAAMPEMVENLVLLNGTFGRTLHSAAPVAFLGPLVPRAVELLERLHGPVGALTRGATKTRLMVKALKRLGLIGETLEDAEFYELVQSFGSLDMQVFLRNLRALGDHDASRVLSRVAVPTLVITGDKDAMTPRGLSQQMVRRIPKAEILVVRGGTHYTAVEFPELVNLRIERFYREHGFE